MTSKWKSRASSISFLLAAPVRASPSLSNPRDASACSRACWASSEHWEGLKEFEPKEEENENKESEEEKMIEQEEKQEEEV